MADRDTSSPQSEPLAGPGGDAPPAASTRSPQQVPAGSSDAAGAGAAPAKRKADIGWGAVISAAGVVYLLWQLAHGAPINWVSLALTIGALSWGARLILVGLAVGGVVAFGWLFFVVAWIGIGVTAVLGVYRGTLEPMTAPTSVLFIHPPVASPFGACTMDPAAWALHGLHPGQCGGIAWSRLGLAALCVVVLAAMRGIGHAATKK